jgi:hypothetical protein
MLNPYKLAFTVTNEGHASAHDPGSAIVRVRMNLDFGIFAPLIMRSEWTKKIWINAHQLKKIKIDTNNKILNGYNVGGTSMKNTLLRDIKIVQKNSDQKSIRESFPYTRVLPE